MMSGSPSTSGMKTPTSIIPLSRTDYDEPNQHCVCHECIQKLEEVLRELVTELKTARPSTNDAAIASAAAREQYYREEDAAWTDFERRRTFNSGVDSLDAPLRPVPIMNDDGTFGQVPKDFPKTLRQLCYMKDEAVKKLAADYGIPLGGVTYATVVAVYLGVQGSTAKKLFGDW